MATTLWDPEEEDPSRTSSRSTADVAEELSMSPGAVRVAKCRVLRRLRAELGDVI